MSQYYNSQRIKGLYAPNMKEPFKLSRSKIDLFLDCPRCFYMDRKLGVGRPPGFPFTLNSAVDRLLKKEFDINRVKNKVHPLLKSYGVDLVPFQHKMMDEWRDNFKGVQYLHKKTNFIITGAVDDVWADQDKTLYVVEYKATSKNKEITELDEDWQDCYKRQMEIYQWLLRQNNYKVSNTGYFVYCNGNTDKKAFDSKLEFDVTLIPYKGNDDWIENTILNIHKCLNGNKIPKANPDCDYCNYREAVNKHESSLS